jgi:hypothetical protein
LLWRGLWGTSGTNLFIVGASGDIQHYNGSSLISMASGTTKTLNGVWGSSGSDVFAVGYNGAIVHYNGSTWSPMSTGTTFYLSAVWGSSSNDVFAVGDSGAILHYGNPLPGTTTTIAVVTSTTSAVITTTTTTAISTVVELSSFTATPANNSVILHWEIESEIDNSGFNLYRSDSEDGDYIIINAALIPAKGSSMQGASYEFIDTAIKNRRTYYYKLEDIDFRGVSTFHGPVTATPRIIYGRSK